MLDVFGLSAEAESVYRAMLASPTCTVSELALATAVDEAAVVRSLEELRQAAIISAGPDGFDEPLPPEQAIEALIAREEEMLSERRRRLSAQREGVGDLVRTFVAARQTEEPSGSIERLVDGSAVRARLYELEKLTTQTCWSMRPSSAPSVQSLDSARRLDQESMSRGVGMRWIVSATSLADQAYRDYLSERVADGGEVRVHPAPPMAMILLDETVSVIPDGDQGGAVILHGAALSLPVRRLFDEAWSTSAPLGEWLAVGAEMDSRQLRSRQVVTMMAQGMTDEAIARRLGVSVRTVGRLISTATDALGATGRFQAGVLAVQKGWVSARSGGATLN